MKKLTASLCCAAIVVLGGCAGGSGHKSNEKYYLVSSNVKISYWQSAAAGLNRAAHQLDVTAEMVGPDTYDAQAEQQAFRTALSKKPAGILISAADPNLLKSDIDSAAAQGVPVITIDSDAPESKRLFFIGTNNQQAGRMGGQRAVKELNGKGSVAVFTMPGQVNLEERLHGYKDAFSAYPNIKIVKTVDVKGDPRVAFDQTNEMTSGGKTNIDGFICLEAIACKEVADVLDRNKVSGKVVIAMDTDEGTLDWIKKGAIQATIAQKPFTMAYFGLKMLGDLFLNKMPSLGADFAQDTQSPLPGFVDTGATLIDKSNVDAFVSSRNSTNAAGK